ncbi:hypothetical protein SASPL_126341 [Salvia splendens]|uniref:Uncharacterized protein n=1 Tax=Salvia splendens TaxID=180675 RepID=A0A8X8ZPY3_SALSN|nr:hypothetical protein SASPL_126341 [Salvia splendens]
MSKLTLEEGLTEQQRAGLCGLQWSTDEAEEAITDGFETLNQSLTQTIVGDTLTMPPLVNTYMAQMVVTINKVSALQGFDTQAIVNLLSLSHIESY